MRKLLLLSSFIITSGIANAAEPSTQSKLDERKAEFSKTASEKKKNDYEEGIRLVEQSGVLDGAKNVGDTAPDFMLNNAVGEPVKLSSLLEQGPVVMIWYRGEWCPYCNIYLEDIQAHVGEFKEAGAQVVAISPETPDNGWTLQDKLDIEFHVLSDFKSEVAEEYGILYELPPKIAEAYESAFELSKKNDDDRFVLPLSASYVIDQDGTITYAFLDADYRNRAETSVLLEEVKGLK